MRESEAATVNVFYSKSSGRIKCFLGEGGAAATNVFSVKAKQHYNYAKAKLI
ncbi:hypothetical protein [Lysinibacillus sp. NPDC096259]|uniref:hypothetical protein n=1 Tax=Lysinibacillus sp. NPDC096259 TaxID=3390583 RepID=UPI003D05C79E